MVTKIWWWRHFLKSYFKKYYLDMLLRNCLLPFNQMFFNIKIDLNTVRFSGWKCRKIPIAKRTPVTMVTLHFLAVFLLLILLLNQNKSVKPEKKIKSQPMSVSPFAWFLAGVQLLFLKNTNKLKKKNFCKKMNYYHLENEIYIGLSYSVGHCHIYTSCYWRLYLVLFACVSIH